MSAGNDENAQAALTTLMINRGVFSRDDFSRSPKFRVDFRINYLMMTVLKDLLTVLD
jgi:hypothetical protein